VNLGDQENLRLVSIFRIDQKVKKGKMRSGEITKQEGVQLGLEAGRKLLCHFNKITSITQTKSTSKENKI
jgi:hypothetical protein